MRGGPPTLAPTPEKGDVENEGSSATHAADTANEKFTSTPNSSNIDYEESLTEDAASVYNEKILRVDDGHSVVEAKRRDDGLVDIRIDSNLPLISRMLSSVSKPQFETADNFGSEPLYELETPIYPPSLNIVIQVVGSRGDLQPFIPIAKQLQKLGHRVRVATHTLFRPSVESEEIEFFDIGGDPAELMAYMVNNPGLLPSYGSAVKGGLRRKRQVVRELLERCWLSCFALGEIQPLRDGKMRQRDPKPFVADAIIANPPSFAHLHCAQKLGVPLHVVFTMPWSPTRALSHPLANIRSTNLNETMSNYFSYMLIEMLIWQGLKGVINTFRTRTLKLEPINSSWGPLVLQRLKIPISYCWSPSIVAKPRDWGDHITVAGFCKQQSQPDYVPPKDLEDFLAAEPPPIYVGFGSIVVDNPAALMDLILNAVQLAGVRAVVAQGWSGIDTNPPIGSEVFLIDSCPHKWLFRHVSCVVHHGGAGTTAAGLQAGKPTVAVPFFGDQFFWARRVSRIGAGPHALPYRDLTVEKLAEAIQLALRPECVEIARTISLRLETEDGARCVSSAFHATLPTEALRCSLDPSRTAAWSYRRKKTSLNISAFAANVLREQGVIDFKHLEPFRSVEYTIDQGPWEPFGSSIAATTGLVYNTFKGLGKMAMEVDTVGTKIGAMGQKDSGATVTYSMQKSSSTGSPVHEARIGENFVHGARTLVGASLRAPGNFTMALAQGAHNMPRLWNDRSVREQQRINGVGSGIAVGCKELVLGTYDGIAGLITQPYDGAREGGVLGFCKGIGKGLVGAPMKLFAAAAAPVAYPLKGLDVGVSNAFAGRKRDPVVVARIEQGEWERLKASDAEKRGITEAWRKLQSGPLETELS